ncbi:hypothetical protein HO173_006622 [Letharia columbiana]|uniref:Peptidase A1 domain-containing protein n=1 Tax=Letharia columbiana TaxID=112416 RepID=A0A8H6L4R1_9LECA|nr:uncharacterized protein HO173_006622 [Letharia columbiana]KAF6235426.1 hypothetical protein HO173_006622 [Letharia columbiana]
MSQWDTNVTIGGQNVTLEIDTGSSFLWVLDPSLSALNSSNRGTYDYTKSRTVSPVNESFTVAYGGGLVTGRVIEETVTIGGLTFNNVSMGIANASSPYFLEQPSIGLLGLGPQPTYARALPAPFSVSEMQSFALDFKVTGSDGSASIEFGGIDHSKYVGQLANAPLNSTDGHWAVDDVDFSVGNVRMNTSTYVVLDTGAGHNIATPSSVAEAYYSRVPGAVFDDRIGDGISLWLVPCNATLPDLALHIGNGTATVAGASMIGLPVNASTSLDSSSSAVYCNPSIQNASDPKLLGFPFFENNYVVFNQTGKPSLLYAPYA